MWDDPGVQLTGACPSPGFAGVFGYAWVTVLHLWLGVSFRATLLAANGFTAGWLAVYYLLLRPPRHTPSLPPYQRVPTSERFGDVGAPLPPTPLPPPRHLPCPPLAGPGYTVQRHRHVWAASKSFVTGTNTFILPDFTCIAICEIKRS